MHVLRFERNKEGWHHQKDQAERVSAASMKNLLAARALALSGVVPLSLQVKQHCQADQSISAAWPLWCLAGTG